MYVKKALYFLSFVRLIFRYLTSIPVLLLVEPGMILAESWVQVPLRTPAQKNNNIPGGEGMQMIWGISYAPTNPQILYLVSDTSQTWKSIDGGVTWKMKHNGFLSNGGISIAVDPNNQDIVFVAGSRHHISLSSPEADGIYRTVNGGESWQRVKATEFFRLENNKGGGNFAFSGNTIYAGTHTEGLIKSVMGGNPGTWVSLNVLVGEKILDIKVHPRYPSILFLATEKGLYKVLDNDTVTVEKMGVLPDFPRAIAINNESANIMYVTVGKFGVYKSVNGGKTFESINKGLLLHNLGKTTTYLAMSPIDPKKLFVGYYEAGGYHLLYSNDAGNSWSKPVIMDSGNLIFAVNSSVGVAYYGGIVIPSPVNVDVAIVSAGGSHLESTVDGGESWTYLSNGYSGGRAGVGSSSFSWDPNNIDRFALFLIDFGTVITRDGGKSFSARSIPNTNPRTTPVGALDPAPGSSVIVTAVGSWTRQVLAVSQDGGKSWKLHNGNNGTLDTADNYRFIAFHPQNPNIIYAGKYISFNKGDSWSPLAKTVVAMFPENGDVIYSANMQDKVLTIFKSIDKGLSWFQPYAKHDIGSTIPREIVIAPNNENRIYVSSIWGGIHIWDGKQWLKRGKSNGLTPDAFNSISTQNITVDPKYPNVVYAGKWITFKGHANGVFRSVDSGNSWQNITYNLGTEFTAWALSVKPDNGYIYLGSSHGTWRLPPPYSDDDGDNVLNDGDWSGVQGDNSCRNGNTINCDDNCPVIANAFQADFDNDGIGDSCEK